MPNEKRNKEPKAYKRNLRRVQGLDPLHMIMPHIYTRRVDSEVYISEEFDITELLKFIEEYNAENSDGKMTLFHAILASFSRIIYHRPLLNRFIKNRTVYEREKISLAFMIKKVFDDKSEGAMMILDVEEEMTLALISEKIQRNVRSARDGKTSSTDEVLNFIAKLPWIFIFIITSILRMLDHFLMLPKSIYQGDINYSTAIVTNLGSIKSKSAYHHLSNWGTCGIIIAIGQVQKRAVYDSDGNLTFRSFVDIGVTADERIADGFYFAKSVSMLRKLLSDPKVLCQSVKEEIPYEF
jgi:pyruvate/2-oxoglutarate dehydrogenase complex dihydrolipoamide acyltransferase (E2) component